MQARKKARKRAASLQCSNVEADRVPEVEQPPLPKKRKVRGKGKSKAVQMLEQVEVPDGYTDKLRDTCMTQKEQREGGLPTVDAPAPKPKKEKDVSPILKKLRECTPAACQLWAKAHKAKVNNALGAGGIGTHQMGVAQLFHALLEDEQEIWYLKVADIEDAKKNDPNALFECVFRHCMFITTDTWPGTRSL